jgi:hypothetical protein
MENKKLTCNRLITILDRNGIKIDNSPNIDMILDKYDIMDVEITKRTNIVKVSSSRPGPWPCNFNPTEDIPDNEYVVKFIDDCGKVYACLLKDKYNIGNIGANGYPIYPFYKLYTPEHHIGLIMETFEGKIILSESSKEERRNAYKKILKEKQEEETKIQLLKEKKKKAKIELLKEKEKEKQLYKKISTFPYQVFIGLEIIIHEIVNKEKKKYSWLVKADEDDDEEEKYINRKGIIYKFNEDDDDDEEEEYINRKNKYLINFDDDTTLWIDMGSQKFTIDLEKFKENFDNKLINNSMYFIDKYIKIGDKIGKIDIFDNNKYHLTYKNNSGCWYDLRNVDIYLIEFVL